MKNVCIILIINYFYRRYCVFFTLQNYQILVNMLFTNGYISVTKHKKISEPVVATGQNKYTICL